MMLSIDIDTSGAPPAEGYTSFLVLKFGGTSVSSADNWRRIKSIINSRLAQPAADGGKVKVVVVHSALSKVTDMLYTCLSQVLERRRNSNTALGPSSPFVPIGAHKKTLGDIHAKHNELAKDLGLPGAEVEQLLAPYRQECERVLEGASLLAEVSARTKARVVAMGELMSTTLGAAYLQAEFGGPGEVRWLEAREMLRSEPAAAQSDNEFLNAYCSHEPNPGLAAKLLKAPQSIFITQGFIASNSGGDTVLLGRGGSDTSGAYLAAVLQAQKLEIWTDVPGMFTANPRQIPEARLLRTMTFDEAQELAATGAKVLHPRCIGPVAKHGIPIEICDTFRPQLSGTMIGSKALLGMEEGAVKGISVKKNVTVVNLATSMMWQQAGFLADAFRAFKEHGLSVDLVSTSESSVTASLDPETVTAKALDLLEALLSKICNVSIISNCASVSLVGDQVRATLWKMGPALLAFRQSKVHMLTQAANDLNLSFVVEDEAADGIAAQLHKILVETQSGVGSKTYGMTWTELQAICSPSFSPRARLPSPEQFPDSKRVGVVGWRGMVGSVLLERMTAEDDFGWLKQQGFELVFFSASQAGQPGPPPSGGAPLLDANDVAALAEMAVVLTCQGGDYTNAVHPKLRASGWSGYWIDAASALRTSPDAIIVLDPVNGSAIESALKEGRVRDLVGGNCTVSLMLMALGGLFKRGWVEWLSSMTYQAASGAGAKNMRELVEQMAVLGKCAADIAPASGALELERAVTAKLQAGADGAMPMAEFGAPLAGSLLPFIDKPMEDGSGRSKEEWKGMFETNKILGLTAAAGTEVPIDGQCVRVGALRCHSQAIVLKLRGPIALPELEAAISQHNEWVELVPNTKPESIARLTPAAVSGTLGVAVGRLRTLAMGPEYVTCFTVGDQLLWGAAEPVRRALRMVVGSATG